VKGSQVPGSLADRHLLRRLKVQVFINLIRVRFSGIGAEIVEPKPQFLEASVGRERELLGVSVKNWSFH
jgi:hypothetical protein